MPLLQKTRDQEILVDSASVVPGDHIVIHVGNVIPFDGVVADGEAMINQASMTGEPLGVLRSPGSSVYAGTVVEEGEIAIREMNERVDRTLNSAFDTMTDITDKYAAVLKEYSISSASSYQTKLTELKNMFASLRNSSTELISRTRTLINRMNGDYDAYYTQYLEQLSDLSGKIETYGDTLENEYLALLSAISDSYETIQ